MSISDWPASERPREKLIAKGADALSDAELLAIFLRTGTRGISAVEMARNLLQEFGSLKNLFSASQIDFCRSKGLGQAKYAQLQATLEMAQRHLHETIQQKDLLSCPADTRNYLLAQLQGYPHEVFAVLFMDNRNHIISFEKMFYGTIDGASVYPREVVRMAIKQNAAAVIFAHNHPSGVAEPSKADELITQRLKDALALIDVRVLDHMVIGDSVTSFAERGLL
jgi:DNA repair protein RadC